MKRYLIENLVDWKNSKNRKPLILQGARQVGKTWLMKEFGSLQFEDVIYLNFESNTRLKSLFEADFDIERILSIIEIEANRQINTATTLLIFDEIQEAEKGVTSLKYFYEQRPELYIIAAGSFLGISMQQHNSFPVGKVDFIQMQPMSFFEFLINCDEVRLVEEIKNKNWQVLHVFHEKLIALLRTYYFIGGMPEAVLSYIEQRDLKEVRLIQEKILLGYENDFSKHAPIESVPRIRLVWQSLIAQLSRENKKFMYGQIKKGARAKDFETAITWLVSAGLIGKVNRIEKPTLPLSAYEDYSSFKLYFLDIGLLNARAGLDQEILIEKNSILTEFKGALTEQYVFQQLSLNHKLYYWTSEKSSGEVDFVIQQKNKAIPIEVKAEENLKAKSLKSFVEKYHIDKAIRTSMNFYREEEWLTNIPLYAIASNF